MNEYEFLVKVEGYKEKSYVSYGNDSEDAKEKLKCSLYEFGLSDILYILEI